MVMPDMDVYVLEADLGHILCRLWVPQFTVC